jgi:hypothetical protein
MTYAELKELALHAVKGTAPENFSVESVNKAFADGLKEFCGSVNKFNKNKYDIFEIIVEAAEEVLPRQIDNALNAFAEVKNVPQGVKAIFRRKLGKQRAKQFVTYAALSGVYETFRLDTETFEVPIGAVGGAVTVDFERMLDGAESLVEVMECLTEGLAHNVFLEVQKALQAAWNSTGKPSANKADTNTFIGSRMADLIAVVRAYGDNAVIFATPEFIAAMGPDAIVPTLMNSTTNVAQGIYPEDDINSIHNTGRIRIFRGVPVVEIPQSYVDENNDKVWINPAYAYVFPAGKEKVVKVVFEGETQINDFKNRDNSIEIELYKKMGCAILTQNNWCIYHNQALDNIPHY